MRLSIRYQLFIPLLILLLGVVGISTWTALASANRSKRQIATQVKNVARTLGESNFPLAANVLEQMKGLSGAEFLCIDNSGRHTSTLASEPAALPPAGDWQTPGLGRPVRAGGKTYLCSSIRLQRRPGTTLYILYPEALWRDALWEAVYPSLVLGAFAGLASLALAFGVARQLGRRIQQLDHHTRLIAAGDFSPMPLPGRHDELRDLGQSVNDMAQQLARLQETVKKTESLRLLSQVSGGLTHQLRNGVTGARLAVQLHARECNGQAEPEALEVALRQLALVEANLKRCLDLGRLNGLGQERCSLTALLDEIVVLVRPQSRHAHIDLRWRPPEKAMTVVGDADQLRHLFLNVITNAIEAAGRDGWVEMQMQQAESWQLPPEASARPEGPICLVEVADSGPGPPPGVAKRLFEPFVTGKREGVGLGLALARQVAEAHGGRISWQRKPDRTCFYIELPLNREPQTKNELCAPWRQE